MLLHPAFGLSFSEKRYSLKHFALALASFTGSGIRRQPSALIPTVTLECLRLQPHCGSCSCICSCALCLTTHLPHALKSTVSENFDMTSPDGIGCHNISGEDGHEISIPMKCISVSSPTLDNVVPCLPRSPSLDIRDMFNILQVSILIESLIMYCIIL